MKYIVATEAEAEVRECLPIVNQSRSVDRDTGFREKAVDEMAAGVALLHRAIRGNLAATVVETNVNARELDAVAVLVGAVAGGDLDEAVEGAAVGHPGVPALLLQGHVQL